MSRGLHRDISRWVAPGDLLVDFPKDSDTRKTSQEPKDKQHFNQLKNHCMWKENVPMAIERL
jgi:hypothetical protein